MKTSIVYLGLVSLLVAATALAGEKLNPDAESYAEEWGISVKEAVERLALQPVYRRTRRVTVGEGLREFRRSLDRALTLSSRRTIRRQRWQGNARHTYVELPTRGPGRCHAREVHPR